MNYRMTILLAVLPVLCGGGCRTPGSGAASVAPVPAWPPPPLAPRVTFCQSVREPADLGVQRSIWRKTVDFIFGGSQSRFFNKPTGVFVDSEGNLGMTDTGAGTVNYFDRHKKTWRRWDRIGKTRFALPVAVVKKGDVLFVADSALVKVVAMDLEGKLKFEITRDLKRPSGLAIAGNTLLVADSQAHCIRVYDLAGQFLKTIGSRGRGPGQFNFPTHLAVDGQGRIYVTDSMNSRIQVLDSEGRAVQVMGSLGDSSGHFSRPKGVAVDGQGHVFIVDALFDNIQIFDPSGRFLLGFGKSGTGPGEFWLPSGLAIGPDNRIVVADSYNSRIQLFNFRGGDQ